MDSPFETLSLALAMTYESDDRGNVTTKAAHNVVIIDVELLIELFREPQLRVHAASTCSIGQFISLVEYLLILC